MSVTTPDETPPPRVVRQRSTRNVTAEHEAAIEAAYKAVELRQLRQFNSRDSAAIEEKIMRFWAGFPEGIRLVVRAAETARTGFIYRGGKPFLLTIPDLEDLMLRSEGRCELSGVPFSGEMVAGSIKRPFIPSIDRIKPKEAYTPENVRLVCWAVNLALGEWGDAVFWKIVRTAAARAARNATPQ